MGVPRRQRWGLGGALVVLAAVSWTRAAQAAPGDIPGPSLQEEGEGPEDAAESEGPSTRVSCLDQLSEEGQRRKGVQKRDFLKRHAFELSGLGGYYASDVLSSTYIAAASASYFLAEDFGVELLGSYTPVRFRLEEPFSSFDEARRFQPSSALSVMGALLFSPFHAKFKFTDATIVHGDLFLLGGGGRTFTDSVQGWSWQAGVGLQLYLMRHLSFRLDVRDFISPQEVLGRARVSHNIGIMGGFGFWLG